jgi:hypothetical protein
MRETTVRRPATRDPLRRAVRMTARRCRDPLVRRWLARLAKGK